MGVLCDTAHSILPCRLARRYVLSLEWPDDMRHEGAATCAAQGESVRAVLAYSLLLFVWVNAEMRSACVGTSCDEQKAAARVVSMPGLGI
jgi:hypothetical protein